MILSALCLSVCPAPASDSGFSSATHCRRIDRTARAGEIRIRPHRRIETVRMTDKAQEPHALTAPQRLYIWLTLITTTCLLVANAIGVKLFQFQLPFHWPGFMGGHSTLEHTCGMLTFPITFLITDLMNEYYGQRATRRAIYASFTMAMIAFVAFQVAEAMPHWNVGFNIKSEAFTAVFSSASVMYLASMAAYVVGSLSDIFLFGVIKRFTGGKLVWLRSTGSTIISQAIDSFIVTWIAFSLSRQLFPGPGQPDPMPMNDVIKTAATGYTLKFLIAIGLTPAIYLGRWAIKRHLGLKPLPPDQTH